MSRESARGGSTGNREPARRRLVDVLANNCKCLGNEPGQGGPALLLLWDAPPSGQAQGGIRLGMTWETERPLSSSTRWLASRPMAPWPMRRPWATIASPRTRLDTPAQPLRRPRCHELPSGLLTLLRAISAAIDSRCDGFCAGFGVGSGVAGGNWPEGRLHNHIER